MTTATAQMLVDVKGNLIPQYYSTTTGLYTAITDAAPSPSMSQISTAGMALRGIYAQVTPYNRLKMSIEPSSLFVDGFDGVTVDTVNRWTLSGTVPTQANGAFTLNGGTTANATSVAISQPTFTPPGLGFRQYGASITFSPSKVVNQNTHQFFGLGVVTAYAIGTPLTNGFGLEVDITGEISFVVYVAGVRYVINSTNVALITAQGSLPTGASTSTLSTTMTYPTAGPHIILIEDRGDSVFFFIDSLDVPVGFARNLQPQVQSLPLRVASVNAAASVLATTFTIGGVVLGDSTSQNNTVSDPVFPWRRQSIGADGAAASASGGQSTVAVAAAGSANVKASAGRLCRVVITVAGTASITFYDNAAGNSTGTIIGITPVTTTVGQVFDFSIPAASGISAVGGVGSPGVTVGFN